MKMNKYKSHESQNMLGERIARELAARGAAQNLCADFGVSQQILNSIIRGGTKRTRFLANISECLGIPLGELQRLRDSDLAVSGRPVSGNIPQSARDTVAKFNGPLRQTSSSLPIRGLAAGGGQDMVVFSNNDINEEIPMPTGLERVDGAYGLEIVGTSMVPRYFPKEIVHVNPSKTRHVDDFVVLHVRDRATGQLCGFVKQLKGEVGGKVIVRQFNPPKTLRFDSGAVEAIHVIVGAQRR